MSMGSSLNCWLSHFFLDHFPHGSALKDTPQAPQARSWGCFLWCLRGWECEFSGKKRYLSWAKSHCNSQSCLKYRRGQSGSNLWQAELGAQRNRVGHFDPTLQLAFFRSRFQSFLLDADRRRWGMHQGGKGMWQGTADRWYRNWVMGKYQVS